MAVFTMASVPWLAGTSVSVWPSQSWANRAVAPSGPSVATEAVSGSGTLAFSDLPEGVRYVAFAAGVGVTFFAPVEGVQDQLADRARIRSLEVAVAAGDIGGGIGDIDTSTLVGACTWNADEDAWTFDGAAILARPDFEGILLWHGGDASTDDPTAMMGPYDVWRPESE